MSRLTSGDKHEWNGFWVEDAYGCHDWIEYDEPFYHAISKLAHYEDLEEQGRLIELPCKVGDEVWVLEYDSTFRASGKIFKDEFEIFDLPFMGSLIFATKEEAEAKLAELKGEVNV